MLIYEFSIEQNLLEGNEQMEYIWKTIYFDLFTKQWN